jgi:NurA-like 5'-3' nuclease
LTLALFKKKRVRFLILILYFEILDKVEKEIKDEKEHGKELDTKLQEWEKKLRNKRREVGGTNAGSNFNAQSKKQEKVLENRLDHV